MPPFRHRNRSPQGSIDVSAPENSLDLMGSHQPTPNTLAKSSHSAPWPPRELSSYALLPPPPPQIISLIKRTQLIGAKVTSATPNSIGDQTRKEAEFIKYTPNPNAPGYNSNAKQRVVRMVAAQVGRRCRRGAMRLLVVLACSRRCVIVGTSCVTLGRPMVTLKRQKHSGGVLFLGWCGSTSDVFTRPVYKGFGWGERKGGWRRNGAA